ncbi:MAG: hypothetical protein IPJ89_01705 [Candidatus Iainarchaeum archaeon]|uniref:Class I SAM-dependent methyltransferase n=1 Tax=Candidatus Iainarchaeum sp. TaxID=3101447 RepID=A0A7T9DKE5_9ARCH|nr:MAG: hypothetical protein IPJ89_01705 [Candidatus Diapherotrites archaeon]
MSPKKRLPVGRRATAAHVKEIRRIIRKNREAIAAHSKWLRALSASSNWNDHRSYDEITGLWRNAKIGIINRLIRRGKNNRGKLHIWEDGPGRGYFGGILKEELDVVGIRTHLVATTLDAKSIDPYEKKLFDEVHAGKSELFVPRKPFDFIFSTIGSVNYMHSSLRKQHILKMAYSLAHGGQMFVSFYHRPLAQENERRKAVVGSLLQKPPKKSMHTTEEMAAIEKAFAKRGFTAKFHYLDPEASIVGLHVVRK